MTVSARREIESLTMIEVKQESLRVAETCQTPCQFPKHVPTPREPKPQISKVS